MLELTSQERRALRAQAHALHPVVTIGQQGLTPTVLTEIDLALNAHGLIKVRAFVDDRAERETMFAEIADGVDAAPVQHIGKLFVLWRPQPEPEEEAPARPSARPKRAKTPARKPKEPAAARPFEPVGRHARGQPRAGAEGGAGARGPRGPSAPNPRRRRAR